MYIHWWPPIGPGGQPPAPALSFDLAGNPLPLQPVGGTRLDYGNTAGGLPYVSETPGGVPLYFDAAGNPSPLQSGPGVAFNPAAYGGPVLLFDAAGNPSPVQPGPGGSGPAPSPTFSTVFPWVDYGLPGDSTSEVLAAARRMSYAARHGGGGAFNGEPPWSDALTSKPPCGCDGSSGLLDWIKAHPWLCLAIVVETVVVVANGKK